MDWGHLAQDLDARGCAVIEGLITAAQCDELAALYQSDEPFRDRVVMARHGFGRGEYKYFRYPLPEIVARMRAALYPRLAPLANRWNMALGLEPDRKSTRLNSSHGYISYAVFCLKKKITSQP